MRKQFGLSLVELMISITLGLLLMTGVMKLFLSSKVVFSTQQGLSRIQETGRLAIDFIAHDINEAAYYGCHRPDPDSDPVRGQSAVTGTGFYSNFAVGVMGYDSAASVPGGIGNFGTATPILTSATINANVLVLRSASQQGLLLTQANTPTSLITFTKARADSAGCINGVCLNGIALVADCFKSRLFKVAGLTSSDDVVTVSHTEPWSAATDPLDGFVSGAELMPVSTNVYFLAKSNSGEGSSLWQRINDSPPFELLEGVEQLRITYSLDNKGSYRTASAITDWPGVWSIRVELVVRSAEDNVLAEKQPYNFGGVTFVPTDKRMRQIFTSTTAIRNRITSTDK